MFRKGCKEKHQNLKLCELCVSTLRTLRFIFFTAKCAMVLQSAQSKRLAILALVKRRKLLKIDYSEEGSNVGIVNFGTKLIRKNSKRNFKNKLIKH